MHHERDRLARGADVGEHGVDVLEEGGAQLLVGDELHLERSLLADLQDPWLNSIRPRSTVRYLLCAVPVTTVPLAPLALEATMCVCTDGPMAVVSVASPGRNASTMGTAMPFPWSSPSKATASSSR